MPPLNETTKAAIDEMSKDELVSEINLERHSKFQNVGYAYLKTRLAEIEAQESAEQRSQDVEHRATEISIAKEANALSRKANRNSWWAFWVSVAALLVAAYVAYTT